MTVPQVDVITSAAVIRRVVAFKAKNAGSTDDLLPPTLACDGFGRLNDRSPLFDNLIGQFLGGQHMLFARVNPALALLWKGVEVDSGFFECVAQPNRALIAKQGLALGIFGIARV